MATLHCSTQATLDRLSVAERVARHAEHDPSGAGVSPTLTRRVAEHFDDNPLTLDYLEGEAGAARGLGELAASIRSYLCEGVTDDAGLLWSGSATSFLVGAALECIGWDALALAFAERVEGAA